MPEIIVRDWFACKRTGPVLLRVSVTNREKRKVKFSLKIEAADDSFTNVALPHSVVKDSFYEADTKCILHLQKIDPTKPFGKLRVSVVAKALDSIP